ncbi:hypothetical protein GCK32_010419 [Trichostrongylus colubriformis]|uniref:Uncharacterized protein n=1 Tax=Trichostrongylus colubriformis TaxID=6319 RepID=A0AAN8IWZ1_TRICO
MHPENEPVLHVLGNVLGALGNVLSLNITRTVLNVQGPEFLDDYLLGAAHTTSNDGKWHKQLMYWMADVKEEEETYWKVANTIATILRRRCERTPSSRNSCHHGKEKIVAKFIKDISTCSAEKCHLKALEVLKNIPISASFQYARGFLCSAKYSPAVQIAALQLIKAASSKMYDAKIVAKFIKDISTCSSEKCHHKALEVLRNIPISASVEYARGFLCSAKYSPAVQIAALQLIKAASSKLYDAKLANVLIRLFRNVCPQPTTTSESQLAIDILLRCVPEQQHVATMLLRSESLNPENAEKWQYFYKAVESSAQKDELTDEFWRQMRKFKVFRPNYAHRSLEAGSHAHWQGIAEVDGYKLFSTSEVEFDLGMFKRSEFDINLKHGKVDESLFKNVEFNVR